MTYRIEPFVEHDSKNWTFFFLKKYDSKNWTLLFKNDSKNWTLLDMTQRVEPIFQYDSKNWTFFSSVWRRELILFVLEYDAENWTFFLEHDAENWTFFSWIWLKELNFFYDCKLFEEKMSQRIEPFSVTQRIEFFSMPFLIRHTELNHDFTEYNRQNWTFFSHDSNFF